MNTNLIKNLMLWSLIGYGLFMIFNHFNQLGPISDKAIDYSTFIAHINSGNVEKVEINQDDIYGRFKNGQDFKTVAGDDPGLIGDLLKNNVNVKFVPPQKPSLIGQIFVSWFPMLLLIGVWIFFMKKMGGGIGGSGGPLSFGKSKARMMSENSIKVTFEDVAGADEAKDEVVEVIDFLKEPKKYEKLGGKIPKGLLLVGPPGTGKTLLAKAIAGEANVPFFSISGSDFVEMFVGVGASRVRDMFENAKNHAPCIIFVDEIDAMGRSRSSSIGGAGNDEREQTLNQMLVEMDGIETNEGVILVAATNRPDILDNALLRPGRFDRQVQVPLPDVRGREQILKVHMRKVPHNEKEVNVKVIARGTPGFSGADLANLVNEAALMAAKANVSKLNQEHFDRAKDKIIMGTERKSMVMTDAEKKITAYHESGHAIVGYLVPEHDPVYKVSIIPRGRALGVTMYLPEEDRLSYSKIRLESLLCSLYGGRIAEEIIYGKDYVTTGASNDIERATTLAKNMVVKWGLSEKLGPLQYEEEDNHSFIGGIRSNFKSSEVAKQIDEEVRILIDKSYARATNILYDNRNKLEVMTKSLMKYETIDSKQIKNIMEDKEPGPPRDWTDGKPKVKKTKATTKKKITVKPANKSINLKPKPEASA